MHARTAVLQGVQDTTRNCPPRGNIAPAQDDRGDGSFSFDVFGWNLGGSPPDCLKDVVVEHAKRQVRNTDLFTVQEFPRGKEGWSVERFGGLLTTSYRAKGEWRGQGVAFSEDTWTITKRIAGKKGVWIKMRLLMGKLELWLGVFHFTPGCNQNEYSAELETFFRRKPNDGCPLIVQGDANAPLGWIERDGDVQAQGLDCKSVLLLGKLSEMRLTACPPIVGHRGLPTSRPRQADRQGHQIDLFASSRTLTNTAELENIAKHHTKQRPGNAYRDPEEVRTLFRQARQLRTPGAWKNALAARRKRAVNGDWQAYRGVAKSCKPGWDQDFAASQQADPHLVVHRHLSAIYEGSGLSPVPPLGGSCRAFTVEELMTALGQLKLGKSVGMDLTSTEMLRALVQVKGGQIHLLEYLNKVFVQQKVPPEWNKPLLILLPKTANPTSPKELRPIALSSSTSKLFARMVLNRVAGKLDHVSPAQCAGRGRQPTDVLFTVHRLFQLDQEWKTGICAVKLDISKAFDSVNSNRLVSRLQERLGDGFEMRALRALLVDTEATLQSAWGSSTFPMGSGIKQGAIESPMLFSFLMDIAVMEASAQYAWDSRPKLYEGLVSEELLFMDDGILWGKDSNLVSDRLHELSTVLATYGLMLNMTKCKLYCSPYAQGPRFIRVQGVLLESGDCLEVMGVELAVGMSSTHILRPLLARARAKFWSISHLLRAKASIKARTRLFNKVITNTALWCIAAFPPETIALKLVNSFQFILMGWLLKLGKRADESWIEFRRRVVRSARLALHRSHVDRWSTQWLRQWWGYSGHRVRSLLRTHPPISAYVDEFRTLAWWEVEKDKKQGTGIRHPACFYARLMTMEAKMNRACSGHWRRFAHNRRGWGELCHAWVQQQDLPWCSGLQLSVLDENAEG
eukprot:s2065_g18.t1